MLIAGGGPAGMMPGIRSPPARVHVVCRSDERITGDQQISKTPITRG